MLKRIVVLMFALLVGVSGVGAQDVTESERPLLMAHFMPWYQTPDVSGYWGWHWTMDYFDPAQPDANGRPQIASHFMPLTGPYDSQDDAVLEYQVGLMKLSGIDGVIVDWYGIDDFREYAVLNAATVKLFDYVKRAGLRFIICFEDQIYIHMTHDGYLTADDAIPNAQDVMRFMQDEWFTDPAYLSYDGQPLLFTYGPQYFRNPDDWTTIFSVIDPQPSLVTLDKHMDWAALSSFPWPPMAQSGGIELLQTTLERYLSLFYRNAQRRDLIVGSAFPGFKDIYAQAGVRASFGSINPRDGETLRYTLDLALEQGARIVQLVTWNDYGEGTIIEPTEEFGYQYLEIVQETRRSLESGFAPTADDLRLPLALFNARRAHAGDAEANAQLDEAFQALISGDTDAARAILSAYA
ncbi:MAG: glycoside hydrolase family 71/99-like protein [Anaerolineae bacterium]